MVFFFLTLIIHIFINVYINRLMQKCRKQNERIQLLDRTIETQGNVPYAIIHGQCSGKNLHDQPK